MTDSGKDSKKDELAGTVTESQRLLQEITEAKKKIDEYLIAAESASKKASSEGLFAFQAKQNCEEHSSAIATLKGNADAEIASILQNKQKSDEFLASCITAKASIEGDKEAVSARRKEVDAAAEIALGHAQAGTAHLQSITTSKGLVDAALEKTTSAASGTAQAKVDAEEALKVAQESSAKASGLLELTEECKKNSAALNEEIQGVLSSSKQSQSALTGVIEHLKKSDAITGEFESRLAEQLKSSEGLVQRMEGLLPGATSTGLASSFNAQKMRFKGPQERWLKVFITCIVLLCFLSLPGLYSYFHALLNGHPVDGSWSQAWWNLAMRLPIVAPLIWLGIYAGRNYMLSLRLEEDYAYKEAISTAFEGYKREMEKIAAGDTTSPSPLTILCTNVLRAIAERPGRIYEGKHQDINLATEVKEAIEYSKKKVAAE
jgi:hypothetical protein